MTTPKFTLSRSKVFSQLDIVSECADIVAYSSKTNPLVTPLLESGSSCMFSIHLENELKNVKDKSRVLFFAQGWSASDVKRLVKLGIQWFVVDNESDLDVLLSVNVKVNLLLRVKLAEYSLKTEKYFVFGMDLKVVNSRIREIRSRFEILGVHCHRKTQNMSEWNLIKEFGSILDSDVLEMIDIVNIGGGLPSEYVNTNTVVIDGILEKLKELREWFNSKNIKMMVEPGRFIAAPVGKLITNVIGMYDDNIIVNASVYNTDMDALIVPVKLLVEGELSRGAGVAYKIKGKTPCSMDLFRYRVYLKNVKVGSKIVFLNAGAYNFGSDFCDLGKLETEIVD